MQLNTFIAKTTKLALTTARRVVYKALSAVDQHIFNKQNPLFVLSYHSISDDAWRFSVSKTMLTKQLAFLKKHYDFISMSTLQSHLQGKQELKRPSVVITIDDGYSDVLSLKSYFAKRKTKPALFVLSETQQPNWKELGTNRPFLTANDIKSLAKDGWEIGSHSATHANLAQISAKQLQKETVVAKQMLEKMLGKKVTSFAYPRGKYNQNVIKALQKAKFEFAFTMDDGVVMPGMNAYQIPRIGVDGTHSFNEFKTLYSPSVVAFRKMIKESFLGRYI